MFVPPLPERRKDKGFQLAAQSRHIKPLKEYKTPTRRAAYKK